MQSLCTRYDGWTVGLMSVMRLIAHNLQAPKLPEVYSLHFLIREFYACSQGVILQHAQSGALLCPFSSAIWSCFWPPNEVLIDERIFPQADAKMLTASGDQCVHMWDTASAQGLGQFRGHNGSVKSVCPSPDGLPIFASGQAINVFRTGFL